MYCTMAGPFREALAVVELKQRNRALQVDRVVVGAVVQRMRLGVGAHQRERQAGFTQDDVGTGNRHRCCSRTSSNVSLKMEMSAATREGNPRGQPEAFCDKGLSFKPNIERYWCPVRIPKRHANWAQGITPTPACPPARTATASAGCLACPSLRQLSYFAFASAP